MDKLLSVYLLSWKEGLESSSSLSLSWRGEGVSHEREVGKLLSIRTSSLEERGGESLLPLSWRGEEVTKEVCSLSVPPLLQREREGSPSSMSLGKGRR